MHLPQLLKSHWMQVSHQFSFLVVGNCQEYCIFFHFRSNHLEEKLHVQLGNIQFLKTQVPSQDVLPCEACDFQNWCRCGVCSVQFYSGFCSRWNLHQTNSVLLFWCEHAVSVSWIQKNRYVFCCVLCFQIKFFGVQTKHILSLLQLIAGLIASSFAGFRSAFDLLGFFLFLAKNMFVFIFTASSL